MSRISVLVLVFFAVLVIPSSVSANLLNNPVFETGDISGWTGFGTIDEWWGPPWGHNGGYAPVVHFYGGASQTAPIANPSVSTKVGGWVFDNVSGGAPLDGDRYAQIKVDFKNASGGVVGTWTTGYLNTYSLINDRWNDLTAQITPSSYGAGITQATLEWKVDTTDPLGAIDIGRGYFDDMVVEPIPEPTSLFLLGTGLVGLLGLRKRSIK